MGNPGLPRVAQSRTPAGGTCCRLPLALAVCLLAAATGGCCNHPSTPGSTPLAQAPPPVLIPGVIAPDVQIANLKKLAEDVPKLDPEKRAQAAVELTQRIKKEEDPVLRTEILRTLEVCGGPAAEAVLRCALSDPDADTRVIACGFWGKRGDAEAVQRLAAILSSDRDKDVRMAAARALGSAHDPSAVAPLGRALEDKDPAMQYCAVTSLRKLTGRDLGNDVDRWRAAIKDGSLAIRATPRHWF
ncbi:MAG: HEAT repeat domain-containing protein [Thermoguttaceae bacterium]|jgi:HEAT repeat protein